MIGIIAVLISILLPSLARARASAQQIQCASNQRQIMMAFLMFANDHQQTLPGNFTDYANVDATKRAWLINYGEAVSAAPDSGTVYPYLTSVDVYRCFANDASAPSSGTGSNGRFDYVAFGVFTGAKLIHIKAESTFTYPDGRTTDESTPVITEEDSARMAIAAPEGLHNNTDRMNNVHQGGANYASIDGSVHWFKEPTGTTAWNWTSIAPSGKTVSLGNYGMSITYGWWGSQ